MATPKGKNSTASKILSQTAVYVGDGLKSFLAEAMPTSDALLTDAKSTVKDVTSKFKSTTQSISSTLKALKGQSGLRAITNWYLGEDDTSSFGGDDLDFDIPTDDTSAEIAVASISESKQNANQISSSVVSASAKMMEGNIQLTANILSSIDNQTSVITSGFESVNNTLGKIAEAIAANQDALIKATAAQTAAIEDLSSSKNDPITSMLTGGKFSLSEYKKIISQNIKNDPTLGMLASLAPMLNKDTAKMLLTPETLIKSGMGMAINKIFPDLKKTLGEFDKMVNKELMNIFIGMGDHAGEDSMLGMLGRVFGIKSNRNVQAGMGRAAFDVKATPFDTLTKEAITVTIPGYLQKILAALTGEDTVYDMRTRSFTTKNKQIEAYKDAMLRTGTKWNATNDIQKIFNGDYGAAFYDLMMSDLGATSGRKDQINKFRTEGEFVKYAESLLEKSGVQQDELAKQWFKQTEDLIRKNAHVALRDISNQAAQENVARNKQSEEYVRNAQLYQADLSGASLDAAEELKRIAKNAGFALEKGGSQQITGGKNRTTLTGSDYTNKALYEIYSILHRGINVYRVGASKERNKKFEDNQGDLDKHLKPPVNQRAIRSSSDSTSAGTKSTLIAEMMASSDEEENQTAMGELKSAILSGDPEKMTGALGKLLGKAREKGQGKLREGASKLNAKYGNVVGSIRHKITGKGYSYIDPETGETITIGDTKVKGADGTERSGGIIGYARDYMTKMFEPLKDKGKNWFQKVAKDFDFGDKNEKSDVKAKRKKFISTSVGALAGAGLLGGPLGLLMGGIAGNALGMGGIGDKIKERLFGDGKDGKKKGLFTKIGEGIVNPIRFQFQKTAHHIGDKLRKNVLGPLSDIGFAIKERITSSAKSKFGKAFEWVGDKLKAGFHKVFGGLFSGIGKLFGKVTEFFGAGARGAVTAGTAGVGFGLNRLADIIAGGGKRSREGEEDFRIRDKLKQRRAERNADISRGGWLHATDENGEFIYDENGRKVRNENWVFRKGGGKAAYKEWLAQDEAKRKSFGVNLGNYVAEHPLEAETNENVEKIEETLEQQTQVLADTAEDLGELKDAATTNSTIYTHDTHTEDKLDQIIDLMEDSDTPTPRKPEDSQAVAELEDIQTTIAAAGIEQDIATAMQQGEVSQTEIGIADRSAAELAKDDPDLQKLVRSSKAMNRLQIDDKDKAEEKQETIWDKILKIGENLLGGLFGGNGLSTILKLGGIAGILAGLWKFFNGPNGDNNIANVVNTAETNITSSIDNILNPDENNVATSGANAAANLIGADVDNITDIVNPFADVNHVNTTAGGQDITNAAATKAKNYLLTNPLRMAYSKQVTETPFTGGATIEGAPGTYTSGMIKSTAKGLANVGIAAGAGALTGAAATGIASAVGVEAEDAAKVGNAVSAGTTGVLIAQNATAKLLSGGKKKGILDKLREFFTQFIKKGKTGKFLDNFLNVIDTAVDNVMKKLSQAITEPIAKMIEKRFGEETAKTAAKQVGGAATAGVLIAAGALNGFVDGTIGTEYLFKVLPYQADQDMYNISMAIKSIYGALEWVPYAGIAMAVLYCVDAIFNGLGIDGPTQMLANAIYAAVADENVLAAKQAKLDAQTARYNTKFGSNLNRQEFNDLVNSNDWMDEAWWGKAGGANDNYDVINSFDEYGNRKIKEGTLGYTVSDIFTFGQFGATTKRNEELMKGSSYRASDQDEAKWEVDPNWATNQEVLAAMPEDMQQKYQSVYGNLDEFAKMGDEEYQWAKTISFAAMNTRKAIQEGIWKENEDGSIDKGNSQTVATPTNQTIDTTGILLNQINKAQGTAEVPWGFSEEDYANWKVIENMPGSPEIAALLPDPYKNMPIKELYESGYTFKVNGQSYNAAKLITFASMNDTKAFNEGKRTFNADGTVNYGTGNGGKFEITRGGVAAIGGEAIDNGAPSSIKRNIQGRAFDSTTMDESQTLTPGGNPTDKEMAVSLGFGGLWGNTYTKDHSHGGIDMYPADGTKQANIISRWNGIVTHEVHNRTASGMNVSPDQSTGNNVSILTRNPLTGELMTVRHMHMKPNSIPSNIYEGAEVHVGDKIGEMGTTGMSSGVHLHYQMNAGNNPLASQYDASRIDPTPFFSTAKDSSGVNNGTAPTVSESNPTGESQAIDTKKGFLAQLVDKISAFGQNFLYTITGGLLGSKQDEDTDTSSTTGDASASSYVSTATLDDQVIQKGNIEPVWAMLKQLGYTDAQTAGILGNIVQENGVRSKAIEGDFFETFDPTLYDTIMTDRKATDDWTRRVIDSYDSSLGVRSSAYVGSDGHLYPGMGLVGFTGPVTERYMNWVRGTGYDWDSASAQLAYMDDRIRNAKNGNESYYHYLKEKFSDSKRGPREMAKAFYAHYTSGKGPQGEYDEWAQDRAEYAQQIWDTYQSTLSAKYPDNPDRKIVPDSELANSGVESKGGDISTGNYSASSVPEEVRKKLYRATYKVNSSTPATTTTTYKPYTVSGRPDTEFPTKTDLTEVIQGITVLGKYLAAIADNTSMTNEELSTLNEKDFGVDQELRDTIHAASQAKTHKDMPNFGKASSMKGIMNLAKP